MSRRLVLPFSPELSASLTSGTPPQVTIQGADHHYLSHVLRLAPGDAVVLVTQAEGATSLVAEAVVERISRTSALLQVVSVATQSLGEKRRVSLYMALLKGDRFDWVVQKATELGVDEIVPVLCARCIPSGTGGSGEKRARWERIARGAAQQSRRLDLPTIAAPTPFSQVVAAIGGPTNPAARGLVLWEEERSVHLSRVLSEIPAGDPLVVLVGPEGGFTREEVAAATGFFVCGLGPRILRAETAAIFALSVLDYLGHADALPNAQPKAQTVA